MGFPIVEIRMPEYDGAEAQLQQWLIPTGVYVNMNWPIAHVRIDGVLHQLVCNMPVVLEETTAESSSMIAPKQLMARVIAEGHEIPYGRPYARLERVP